MACLLDTVLLVSIFDTAIACVAVVIGVITITTIIALLGIRAIWATIHIWRTL